VDEIRKAYVDLDEAISEIENYVWLTGDTSKINIIKELGFAKLDLLDLAVEFRKVD